MPVTGWIEGARVISHPTAESQDFRQLSFEFATPTGLNCHKYAELAAPHGAPWFSLCAPWCSSWSLVLLVFMGEHERGKPTTRDSAGSIVAPKAGGHRWPLQ